ncbi:MAG: hypothetical protein WCG21_05765 [Eubacteriales bacterium]
MGKFIRKINRGIIVTSIVVLLVVGYLVVLSINQKQAVPVIKDACQAYVEADAAWRVLPENFIDGQTAPTDSEVKKYADSLEPEISRYYTENQSILENAVGSVYQNLKLQIMTGRIYTSYANNNIKFQAVTFHDNTVTVDFTTQTVTEYVDVAAGSAEPVRESAESTNQITLQKEDGKWKIIYASLSVQNMGGY